MIQLIITLWLACMPAHSNIHHTHGTGTEVNTQDTGGETEPIPPKPPKP